MPADEDLRIVPLGEDCALVSLGEVISEDVNRRAVAISAAVREDPFEGFLECAPAYASVAVYFDPLSVPCSAGTPFESVRKHLLEAISTGGDDLGEESRVHEVPVTFGGNEGPDLDEVAERAGLKKEEVIEIFLGREYRVFMIGFLPGFPYLGTVDERIAVSRRDTPRTLVPAGSIGLAGRQTGIYPFDSPGGWQLIGRTRLAVFDSESDEPAMFRAGDTVRFIAEN